MTARAEQLGAELVMLIRREDKAVKELQDVRALIDALYDRVRAEASGALYGMNTAEQPDMSVVAAWTDQTRRQKLINSQDVPPDPPVASWTNERARPLPTLRPLRDGAQDGGNTFRLTPIADTVTLPAVVDCPDEGRPMEFRANCSERVPHIHTSDGMIQRVRDL